jgi:hypothetical protein
MVDTGDKVSDMTCRHHWVLATPSGARTVGGRCRRCGVEREFLAAWDADDEVSERWGRKRER